MKTNKKSQVENQVQINDDNEEVDASNSKSKKYLKEFLEKVDSEQNNGPFNLRDSGIVEELHRKLEENAVNYDDEPVAACPHCESLYLKEIDDNLECFNCGNPVEEKNVVVYSSIGSYLGRKRDEE